jgi:hypothetical protein
MRNATPPRKQAGRAARAPFVEIENILAQPPRAATAGLIIEAEGLRLGAQLGGEAGRGQGGLFDGRFARTRCRYARHDPPFRHGR